MEANSPDLTTLALRAVAAASIRQAQEEGHIYKGKQQYQFREEKSDAGGTIVSLWVRLWGNDSELVDSWNEEEWAARLAAVEGRD